MKLLNFLRSLSKKILLLILSVIIVIGIIFFIWERNKYKIVNSKLADTVAKKTDSLYIVKYDSIHFNAITGQAYIQNIHIGPDTSIVKNRKLEELPFMLFDINIKSVKINGAQTDKALVAKQIVGDSVIIDNPDVIIYFVKPLQKKTKINEEASEIYDEILGNLNKINVGHVFINNVHIKALDFFSKSKNFDVLNTNIQLMDVLIDSAHNLDTTRTLFCKQIALQVQSFISYNNTRPAIRVKNMNYSGADNLLFFEDIQVNRFESDNGDSTKFLHATNLTLKNIDANEMVKNKNIIVDTIECKDITVYEPRIKDIKKADDSLHKNDDSSGFMHVYSVELKNLNFPNVTFIPLDKNILLGNIAFKINDIKAEEVIDVKLQPLKYSKEAEISCEKVVMKSKDGMYNYAFANMSLNSLHKELKINSFTVKPFLTEKAFADKAHYQKDRYEIALSGIALKNINMQDLLDHKIIASDLIINNTSAKIYRDLNKPLNGISKVGNYPSQMIMKLPVPVNIANATFPNAFIQYTEHEKISDSSGIVTFNNSVLHMSNITNVRQAIQKNNALVLSFSSKALNTIPLQGSFTFFLDSYKGDFATQGTISKFDMLALNKVSVPMALISIKSGTLNSLDFKFTGDDHGAKGDFTMKYNDMKVDILSIDKDSKQISKKGLVSFLANTIVKNDNPANGNLRTETPSFNRDVQKSFFNLVWKTIFVGMKKTAGVPL